MAEAYLQSDQSAVFLISACGSKPYFQGCLRITPIEKVLGTITTRYCISGGERIAVGTTQGPPEPIKPVVEAPLDVLLGWFHQRCPFTLAIAYKRCVTGPSLTKWDDDIDLVFYLPDAGIEREGITNNVALGLDDESDIIMASVGLNVADWTIWEKHDIYGMTVPWGNDQVETIAYCGGPQCPSCSSSCVQAYDVGCQVIWVGGQDGLFYSSADGGTNWTNRNGNGSGQIDLTNGVYGEQDVLAIYCADPIVLVSLESGQLYYSNDSGATWTLAAEAGMIAQAFAEYWGNIFAAGAGGLWVTKDNGVTWEELIDDIFVDVFFLDQTGVAITTGDIYMSKDGGVTWGAIGDSGLLAQAAVTIAGCRIWVAAGDGMAYTDDEGDNWTIIDTDAWEDVLFENCYVGHRVGLVGGLYVYQQTLDGGNTWWTKAIFNHSNTTQSLNVLAACYNRLAIGGGLGFFAQMTTKDLMIPE